MANTITPEIMKIFDALKLACLTPRHRSSENEFIHGAAFDLKYRLVHFEPDGAYAYRGRLALMILADLGDFRGDIPANARGIRGGSNPHILPLDQMGKRSGGAIFVFTNANGETVESEVPKVGRYYGRDLASLATFQSITELRHPIRRKFTELTVTEDGDLTIITVPQVGIFTMPSEDFDIIQKLAKGSAITVDISGEGRMAVFRFECRSVGKTIIASTTITRK
jgi:hypothetical protein